jgi:hypothetical protein
VWRFASILDCRLDRDPIRTPGPSSGQLDECGYRRREAAVDQIPIEKNPRELTTLAKIAQSGICRIEPHKLWAASPVAQPGTQQPRPSPPCFCRRTTGDDLVSKNFERIFVAKKKLATRISASHETELKLRRVLN